MIGSFAIVYCPHCAPAVQRPLAPQGRISPLSRHGQAQLLAGGLAAVPVGEQGFQDIGQHRGRQAGGVGIDEEEQGPVRQHAGAPAPRRDRGSPPASRPPRRGPGHRTGGSMMTASYRRPRRISRSTNLAQSSTIQRMGADSQAGAFRVFPGPGSPCPWPRPRGRRVAPAAAQATVAAAGVGEQVQHGDGPPGAGGSAPWQSPSWPPAPGRGRCA